MSGTYRVVGIHGAPTPETAPHGFGARAPDGVTFTGSAPEGFMWAPSTQWWPLPAPPTEQAPPPEPVKRWSYGRDQVYSRRAVRYRDALNALDRDGVAWGPGRPMSELPDLHEERVIVKYGAPNDYRFAKGTTRGEDMKNGRICWWPLPLPGEAQ